MTDSPTSLDRDRLAKCIALAERGATAGERAAARAAAERVARSAGLRLDEAVKIVGGASPKPSPSHPSGPPRAQRTRPAPSKPVVEPITVEELLRQRAKYAEHLKRRATRQQREDARIIAEQEAYWAPIREEQARRDREWAEQKRRQQEAARPGPAS
ncbi:hypothetical protein QA634_19650 [Methylobacterium sp. CB376]|uniref:hypothetical protein n=1 Tax=unclassified Methylobacterium TaxID=2615210 RepID=UPI0005B883B5|nr:MULTISPECIES: hypothetical protein [Methylobacterium]WFT77540.1 hypothetical protein QA634_19650 [Methylobacterium nodulans]